MSTRSNNSPASVDLIAGGRGFGNVAQRLLSKGMEPGALRPTKSQFKANATTLREKEWEELDAAVIMAARSPLVATIDIRKLGEKRINGLARTVFTWDTLNDWNAAEVGMKLGLRTTQDALSYVRNYLPLPIVHKDFSVDIRTLNESRNLGEGIDVTGAMLAGKKVAEKVEEIVVAGLSSYQFASHVLYGLVDHANVNSVSIGTHWNDASGSTGGTHIMSDVLNMIQASVDDKYFGPWILYVPSLYATALSNDYKTYGTRTIREMLLAIPGLLDVKPCAALPADHCLLVPMDPTQVQAVVGLDVTNFEWDSPGGFELNHKVAAIIIPWVKADQGGQTGLVVLH
jgi:hypothetical protein